MRREPIGVAAAPVAGVAVIVEWALQTYVPDMPPGVVAACAAIAVWVLARPWTVPHAHHVEVVEKAYATEPAPTSHDPGPGAGAGAGLVALLLLAGAATADAQGIRERLEGIGRAALDGAVDEGLSQLEGETGGGESVEVPDDAEWSRPGETREEFAERLFREQRGGAQTESETVTLTTTQLYFIGAVFLASVGMLGWLLRRRPNVGAPESSSIAGMGSITDESRAEAEDADTARLDGIREQFWRWFWALIAVEAGELLGKAKWPGSHEILDDVSVFVFALAALWAGLWVVFGPVNRYVMPYLTWVYLMWGPPRTDQDGNPIPGKDGKPLRPDMHVAVRCTIIAGLFYLLVELIDMISRGVG